ncbi:MAG: class II aldolase/adducin family protein [Planctomycetes bacterium]|nr:class II aldolase/adducin family protein [Planctomycetota bacterium]
MTDTPEHIVCEFVEACHKAASRGLVRCSSGNMSQRLDSNRMLITTSRSWMEDLSADSVCLCRISDGTSMDEKQPSVEKGFHAGILRCRSDVNVVLHFQTPCGTALASRDLENVNYFVIPEVPFYIGPVARILYSQPGSEDLADAVTDAMRTHDMVTIVNHGQVTVADSFSHAIQNASFFELACEIILHGGDELTPLSGEEAQYFLDLRSQKEERNI